MSWVIWSFIFRDNGIMYVIDIVLNVNVVCVHLSLYVAGITCTVP